MKDSRDLIITTALKLFLQRSYYEVTMQDMVNATGLSKGAFYHYFSSKEKVFEEVINTYFDGSQLDVYMKFSQNSLLEFYQDYIKATSERIRRYNDTVDENGSALRANQFALILDAMKLLPDFKLRMEERQKREMKYWTDMIAKARKNGEISSTMNNLQIAKLFLYQNYGISIHFLFRNQVTELTNEISTQFKAIYQTLKN